MFALPEVTVTDITPTQTANQHATIINNFMDAILKDEPLIAPASEGLNSIALANSILLSSWQRSSISMPMNSQQFQSVLDQHMEKSTFRKITEINAVIDLDKSYR